MPRGERHFEVGRFYDKKELSVLRPKMTDSGLRRVHPWQMDRVTNDITASAYDIIQSDVAQLVEHRLACEYRLPANGRRFDSAHRS